MKNNFWNYVLGILFILGGIVLIFKPNFSFQSLVYYVGVVLLITGIFRVIMSIIGHESFLLPGNYFLGGALNALFGIILMINKEAAVNLIPTILGLWLIISGVSGLALVINGKRVTKQINSRYLIENILKLVLGIIIMTTPIITVIFVGWVLGIILIIVGIAIIYNAYTSKNVYKVKIK